MMMDRFRRYGTWLAVLVAVMFVVVLVPAPAQVPAAVLTLGAILAFRWWQGSAEEDEG